MREIIKVLITSITGFVGSHLADYILAGIPKVQISGLARWRSPKDNIRHMLDRITLKSGDLLDLASLTTVLLKQKPDVIFHLATQSYVPFWLLDTGNDAKHQCDRNLQSAGSSQGIEVEFWLRPDNSHMGLIRGLREVRENEVPIKESNLLRPASSYAASKVAEDMLAFQYWLSWKIKTIRTRMFTHTGSRPGEVCNLVAYRP